MPAVSVNVAQAVYERLAAAIAALTAAASISPATATVERSYADWELPLEDADDLRVDIVAVTTKQKAEAMARGVTGYGIPVDIAVRKRFVQADQDNTTGRIPNSVVDPYVYLVELIHELFTLERMTNFDAAAWESNEIVVSPLKEHLHKNRQFTGIIRVTFTATKDL